MNLILGDCMVELLKLESDSVDLILTDIPYGEVNQKSSGLRLLDRTNADKCDFDVDKLIDELFRICRGSFYIFCGFEQVSGIVTKFKSLNLSTRVGVWNKTNPSPMNGQYLWLSGLELCVYGKKPSATFNSHCKKAIWEYPSGHSKFHPTEKPLDLFTTLIEASSNKNDIVLDCCMGSGTTGVACVKTDRKFIGIEREEEYYNIAESRIQKAEKEQTKTQNLRKFVKVQNG